MTKSNILLFALAFNCLPAFCGSADGCAGSVLTLHDCLEISRQGGTVLKNAELDLSAAYAQKREAFTHYLPTVFAGAMQFKAADPMASIGLEDILGNAEAALNLRYYLNTVAGLNGINTTWSMLGDGYMAGITAIQPVFAGGRIVNGNRLASLGIEAASLKKDIAVRDNDDEVGRKYRAVVSLSEKKAALQQAIDLVASLHTDVASAVGAGIAGESDLMQVKLKAKQLESRMVQLRGGEKLAKMDLFNYIGLRYSYLQLDSLVLAPLGDVELSPDQYYRSEDDVAAGLSETKLLGLNLQAKKLEKKMALGEALPQIGVGGFVGRYRMVGDPMNNSAVFASITIPISDWAKTSSRLSRLDCEIQKARNDREYLDSQFVLKIRKEWLDLQTAWDMMKVDEETVALCELTESQKRASYAAGLCTVSELLQAQTELQSARASLVDSRIAYSDAVAVWLK